MESIIELYRIGYGPSSSHTMGPRHDATEFLSRHYDAIRFEADLFGSLAATGKGHLTDKALREVLGGTGKSVTIIWNPEIVKTFPSKHDFSALSVPKWNCWGSSVL